MWRAARRTPLPPAGWFINRGEAHLVQAAPGVSTRLAGMPSQPAAWPICRRPHLVLPAHNAAGLQLFACTIGGMKPYSPRHKGSWEL